MIGTTGFKKFRGQFFRRGQAGQSLIILAIGFIALLGFVGIVTDVSLLFVRYSTLRRAVDAAAVASAGQMRRVPVSDAELISRGITPDTPAAETAIQQIGQSTSVANLNLAARQFIEVYGLNPNQVVVETCYAQQIRRDVAGRPLDADGDLLYTYDPNPPYAKTGDNSAGDAETRRRYEELCKDNEAKLVRVTAQIESPTVFLRLLGFPTITLTETSISQTAVLDVVLILDVSESMSYETTYDDWEEEGYYYRYAPPYIDTNDWATWQEDAATNLLHHSMDELMAMVEYGVVSYGGSGTPPPATIVELDGSTRSGPTVRFLPPDMPVGVTPEEPSPMCQVRVAPLSGFSIGSTFPSWLREEYEAVFGDGWVQQRYGNDSDFRGFIPMYRSYACCNDPNGDFDFGDLVCQPMQRVREATSQFLNNLDFIRGDRVAFVTFDNQAHIVDPDGVGGQRSMIETEHDLETVVDGMIDPAIDERNGAVEVLNAVVGVRSEPTYYADGDPDDPTDDDGRWDGLTENGSGQLYDYFQTTAINDISVQPSVSSCFLDRAVLHETFVPSSYHNRQTGHAVWSLLSDAVSSPDWYWDIDAADLEIPIPGEQTWEQAYWTNKPALRSAEYRGGCGSGNIGGALARSQQAFIDGGRTDGAVWLMVLLSDGASGVSDPVARTSAPFVEPNVFQYFPAPDDFWDPEPGDYGAFGVCPYGTDPSSGGTPGELLQDNYFPYCSDKAPETRHYCSDLPMPPTAFELEHSDCDEEFYDTDDYAKDWADWIALADLPVDDRYPIERASNEQLPTIFTIGIGLDFSPIDPETGVRVCADDDWNCRRTQGWTYEDTLGEQLLRYIGDVGDNFRIDDDYWQCQLRDRLPVTSQVYQDADPSDNSCDDKADPDWGPRGPCEVQTSDPSQKGLWTPLDPQESCGNYFAAATDEELDRVFSIIASRMFTRLSQ